MDLAQSIVFLVILFFSFVLHELAHGYMAEKMGDTTARDMGRLTVNPIPHLDTFGSIILPLILIASGSSIVLGWPKQIPVDPSRFTDRKKGLLRIGLAGLGIYLFVALIFGILLRVGVSLQWNQSLLMVFSSAMQVNLVLMVFNLVPVPNFDGFAVLQGTLSEYKHAGLFRFLISNQMWLGLITLVIFWMTPILDWVVSWVSRLVLM